MNTFKKMWPYMLIIAFAFYILPLTGKPWGNEILLIFLALPVVSFAVSFTYGMKNGFSAVLPQFVGIVFLSTLFIFYNYTAWIYVIAYTLISAIGCGVGSIFYKRGN